MPVTLSPFSRRRLGEAGLDAAELEVLKDDGRSRVWRVSTPAGERVVKRFDRALLRQLGGLLLGLHPAQRELRWNRRLAALGVPVVPIDDAGVEGGLAGVRVWLSTPYAGVSLQRALASGDRDGRERGELIDEASALTLQLVRAGLCFRDLKPSNMIVDESGTTRLIDVGGVRRARGARDVNRMLGVMVRVLARDGLEESLRQRFLDAVRAGLDGIEIAVSA
jgi:tRNA A-37 threonylcarbamoyl transferase component Bud32